MESKKKRGRQPGVTKVRNKITHPLLGKYRIEIEENSFNVFKEDNTQPMFYVSEFDKALHFICCHLIVDEGKTHSILGYKNEFNQKLQLLNKEVVI